MTAPTIELRKISISLALSEETTAFHALIYVNGQRCGEARNDGQGGSTFIHWDGDAVLVQKAKNYISTLPPKNYGPAYEGGEDIISEMDDDVYIDDLVSAELEKREQKKLRKLCATKVLFRLKGDPLDEYRTLKAPYTETTKAFIVRKYGEKVESILNEQFQPSV